MINPFAPLPIDTRVPSAGAGESPLAHADATARTRFAALIDEPSNPVPQGRDTHAPGHLRNQAQDHAETRRAPQEPSALPYFSSRVLPPAMDTSMSAASAAPVPDEVVVLLQQFCSAVFVGESPATGSRVVLALDAALPGAAAEFIREGNLLRVRLRARDDATFRLMSTQRDSLHSALVAATRSNVAVDVIFDEGALDGSAA
jgi:hypothetical protein